MHGCTVIVKFRDCPPLVDGYLTQSFGGVFP
jgi:hypothetical protein